MSIARFIAPVVESSLLNSNYVYNENGWLVSLFEDYQKVKDPEGRKVLPLRFLLECVKDKKKQGYLFYGVQDCDSSNIRIMSFSGMPGEDIKTPKHGYSYKSYRIDREAGQTLLALFNAEVSNVIGQANLNSTSELFSADAKTNDIIYTWFRNKLLKAKSTLVIHQDIKAFRNDARTVDEWGREYAKVQPPRICHSVQEQMASLEAGREESRQEFLLGYVS